MTPIRCRHCGAPLATDTLGHSLPPELVAPLTALSRKASIPATILRLLIQHFRQDVPIEMIVETVYGGTRGGPLSVDNLLRVRISELRHIVRPLGLRIVNERFPSSYRLDFEEAP